MKHFKYPDEPRINAKDLVMVSVAGQIAHPIGRMSPYRVGHDGISRILPGTGGINVNTRIGDRCVGLAGDHIEPGVAIHNNGREIVGDKNGPNLALLTYACVGNIARVISGPCAGQQGTVTGKHGGIDHLLADFPDSVLRRLRIGDKIQVYSYGLGMKFLDYPDIRISSCAPRLIRLWGLRSGNGCLWAPVTHLIPAAVMGSGVGANNSVRGDYDIQLFDPEMRRRFRLESLRFGDFVAVLDSDAGFGRSYREGRVTIGVIVHGDSTVSGHGPGVLSLLTGPRCRVKPIVNAGANLARVLNIRQLPHGRAYSPLIHTKVRRIRRTGRKAFAAG